jgi:hypothetical protein
MFCVVCSILRPITLSVSFAGRRVFRLASPVLELGSQGAHMIRYALRLFGIFSFQLLAIASITEAQTALSEALLEVTSTVEGSRRLVDGRLYGATVDATISDRDGDPTNFQDNDFIRFAIGPRGQAPTACQPPALCFNGPRSSNGEVLGFEEWARQNANTLFTILFPAGLASSVLARGAGELQTQEILLTTAFETQNARSATQGGRATAGGLIEYESIEREGRLAGDSAWAWQGLLNLARTFSLQGRFVQQREVFTTRAVAFSADYHPFVEIDGALRWRIGASARGGILYSRSNAMDLGSLEFGGGGWLSVFKDLGIVRIGGGTMLQGSKSHIPSMFSQRDDDLAFLAAAINSTGFQYDLAYGATAGVDLSSSAAVIVKVLKNRALSSPEVRPDSRLLLAGLSFRFGLPSVNFGYKRYSTTGLQSNSLFMQGNFNW